ncbi:rod shape-determining protein MreD [Acinetobacter qingfengensis]|uniref:Rod shape-determining protein MreD n=1 Tax=Acinetobacter qingfengensis TaxID=1262585 RepID=A0A1E7RFU8_9GAMM|nr:rod shape-determining protein MreD [Acinetobacter qingfengensis]KAA8732710.1 rod shape-determining protein MreD [Acinetobacter qingfengensis]OEY98176.1 rod shape-determining protein MreD [Acinetobacter qingfengensis]
MQLAKKENFQSKDPLWAIIFSVMLASVLMIYPLPYDLSAWRPSIMLLVMLFWIMCQPAWCGVWFAFVLGIFTDLLMEMPLGVNALCFISIAFVSRYLTREKRIMTVANLWLIAYMVEVAYLLFLWLILVMSGEEIAVIRHWSPLLSSILIWPVIYYGLKKWRAA